MDTEYDDLNVSTDNRSASIIQIDNGKAVAAVAICAAFAGLALAMSIHATYIAQQAAMEARVFQEKANQLNGKFDAYKEMKK